MAGIRLGMCFAQESVIDLLKKVKMPYNVNVLTQETALKQLDDMNSFSEELKVLLEGRKWLEKELATCSIVKKIFPSDSNFLLVRVDDADRRYRQLIERGLVVRNRSREPLCEDCLRITVGTPEENRLLIEALRSF